MMRSLFSGVAGLKTHQVKMDVIGNNIANVNTTSFKSQSITFSDLMYQTTQRASRATETTGGVNARQIGLGAKSGAIATAIEQQGATETTNNPFDMRITGDAFYIVNNGNETLYTRDGSFYVDGAGNLAMQSTGYFVYGWTAVEDEQTGEISVNTNGGIGKLQIMSAENQTYPPEGTTEAVVSGNIDANDTNVTSDAGKTVTLEFYDNLGYLYTAKFAVRDVNELEHTYTMTLEDIMDSKGNTIGAEKLSYVTFKDTGEDNHLYDREPIRPSYQKTTVIPAYTIGTYTSSKAGFKDPSGVTAYTVPVSGTVASLNASNPDFLRNVYSRNDTTGYYEINSDGTVSIYEVVENADQQADISDKLGSYYISTASKTKVTYKNIEGKSAGFDVPTNFDEAADLSEQKQAALKDLFGLDVTTLDYGDPTATPPYTVKYTLNLSSTGLTGNYIKATTYTAQDATGAGFDTSRFQVTGTDAGTSTISFADASDPDNPAAWSPVAMTGSFAKGNTPQWFTDLYGNTVTLTTPGDTTTYNYTIDDTGKITVTAVGESSEQVELATSKTFVPDVDATAGTVKYHTVASGAATSSIPLEGTLTPTVKTTLANVFGYVPEGDNVTYKITPDGSQLSIYNKGSSETYDITTTQETVTMNIAAEVNASTATYTNNYTGKVIYDSIPRSGYVSDLNDAPLTATFFTDVYGYTPDNTSADYENLTYTINDDGTLSVRTNYITLKYDAKTGDIVSPEGKIVLDFDQNAVIDGQPKMAGFTDVNMDLSSTTNYNTSATSTIGAVKGDLQSLKTGRSVGEMNGITIGKDGTIYATYSNGQTKLLGQIATAEFANASGLEKQGDNLYASTLNSGEATVQDVTMDGGYITTGVLEMSNVDLSSEFTNMITTQRGFQANSRIITVSDTLLEELTNLKR